MPTRRRNALPLPRNTLFALRDAGIDTAAMARKAGLAPEALDGPLTAAEADAFLCLTYAAIGDPAIGLYLGTRQLPELFGVVGVTVMTSPTFGVAIRRMGRYNQLVWANRYEVETVGALARVRVVSLGADRPYSRAKIDLELASILTIGRQLTRVRIEAQELGLRGPPPSYRARYQEVFGCPVLFDQPDDVLTFRASDLALPLVSANDEVAGLVEASVEAALSDMSEAQGAAARVRAALGQLLRGDIPEMVEVARQLGMSDRTLQRRLLDEGTSYSRLLDEVRRELACRYLTSARVGLSEIAYLLGFANPNSFFRAFKRWTGTTPDAYRHGGG
jgi:AraC-like DNA-binding protein